MDETIATQSGGEGELPTMPLAVAPMEGVTILPTRLWLASVSQPSIMTTPFLRATRASLAEKKCPEGFAPELDELAGAVPYRLTPQLLAGEPEPFLHMAQLFLQKGAGAVELNCGCPSPAAVGRFAGSGILRDPQVFDATLAHLGEALGDARFAVKMRIGFADPAELDELLAAVKARPFVRLTVHGRTRADGYRGAARWDAIERVASTAQAPTWASGDVVGMASMSELLRTAPSISGVMIGRGILSNPWIFTELREQRRVNMTVSAFAQALYCFALIHEIWLAAPRKLLARVANGRFDFGCGVDPEKWERLAASLSPLLGQAPLVLDPLRQVPTLPISPTVAERVRYLWKYLRTSLDPRFHEPRLLRIKRLDEFLQSIFELARGERGDDEVPLTHMGLNAPSLRDEQAQMA